jgi:alanine racemase
MPGDTDMIGDLDLIPLINSLEQMIRQIEALPGHPFGVQLDTGMNRLGMEPTEWAALREIALGQDPRLVMSHLACADEPDHPMNARQLDTFLELTQEISAPCSLANTGGVLLGPKYHFDLTRPGIGLYGGLPFADAHPVAAIEVPVIQCRTIAPGESVGYGNAFTTTEERRIATVSAGYADGIIRAMGSKSYLWAGDEPCPLAGRISMDMMGVDVTHLPKDPKTLELLGPLQTVDVLADHAGTIGYEILTSLGNRYQRRYIGG